MLRDGDCRTPGFFLETLSLMARATAAFAAHPQMEDIERMQLLGLSCRCRLAVRYGVTSKTVPYPLFVCPPPAVTP